MSVESEILADGPIAYYPLRSGLLDASGNGNDLTIFESGTVEHGSYWPFGGAGTRGTAVHDTGVSTAGDWTIEFRVERKEPLSGPDPHGLVWQDDGSGGNSAGAMPEYSSTGYLEWGGISTYAPYKGEGYSHRYIAVCEGGSVTIYRGLSYSGGASDGVDATWSGGGSGWGGNWLIGNAGGAMYGEVAIFDYAIGLDRVLAHLTGTSLLPEPEPDSPTSLDDFSTDGPLSDSTPNYGFGWSDAVGGAGSTDVVSGELVSTNRTYQASLQLFDFFSDECLDPPSVLSVDVELGSSFYGGVFLGWAVVGEDEALVAEIFASFGGSVSLSSRNVFVGSVGSFGDTSLPISTPGTYNLTVSFEGGGSVMLVWVDGVEAVRAVLDDNTPPVLPFKAALRDRPCDVTPTFGLLFNDSNATVKFSNLNYGFMPLVLGGLDAPALDGGLLRITGLDLNVYMDGLDAPELDGGLTDPINPDLLRDVHVGGLDAPALTGGLLRSHSSTTLPPGLPITTPGFQYGPPPSNQITVPGYTHRKTASFSAPMNSAGSGGFETLPPGPSEGDQVTIAIGGTAVFTGYASTSDNQVDTGEEDAQTVSVELGDMLEIDWTETVVWPDIAASEPGRLGRPPQDDRTWGWHINAGTWTDDELTFSVGSDNSRYGTDDEIFAYPDNWADSYSSWMWDRNPDGEDAPKGWVYFRVPFGLLFAKEVGIFLCAWDYATLAIDGQQFIEADQPGATFRHDLHLDWDYHLVTIAAYTEGGKGGVNCSIMPKEKHGFTPSVMNSRGGWKCLGYPEKPLRHTTGKVLERLVVEAARRGAPAGDWTLAFDKDQDSAGNAWPEDDPLITTRVGMTYWDVLNMLAEDRIDFRRSASGKTLYAYVKGNPPRSVSSPWAAGVDLAERTVDRSVR